MGEIFKRVRSRSELAFTGERFTTAVSGQIEIEHLHRYFLAREMCRGKDVLDVASGEGYGTALLAQVAHSAIGVEISADASSYARETYLHENLTYMQGDARAIPLEDASVDVAVSFETIEHFYEHRKFLTEIKRVLRPDGILIISSPQRDIYSPPGSDANPYHINELSRPEFLNLLGGFFSNVSIMGQRPLVGSAILPELADTQRVLTFERRGADHFEASSGLPRAIYDIAIASDTDSARLPLSVYIERDEVGKTLSNAEGFCDAIAEISRLEQRSLAAETAYQDARAEIVRCMEQSQSATQAYETRLSELNHTVATLSESASAARSALEQYQNGIDSRDDANTAQLEASQNELKASREELAQLQSEILNLKRAVQNITETAAFEREAAEAAQRTANFAARERDAARYTAQLSAMAAERHWKGLVDDLQSRLAQSEADHLCALGQAALWSANYHRLRGTIERFLRLTGIFQASRLIPRRLRRSMIRLIRGK